MRILGIDPGLATIGIGIIESGPGGSLLAPDWFTMTTAAGLPLEVRLQEIQKDLSMVLENSKPDIVVIEKLFFATNAKTAIDVAQARGVILLTVAQCGAQIIEATPLQLKLAITGDGKADKTQVQTMLMKMLTLSSIPTPDDAADALALAVYGSLTQRHLAIG